MRDHEFNEDVSGDWRSDVGKEQRKVRSFDMETCATPRKPFPSGSWHRNGSEHQFSSAPSCDYVRRSCTAFPAVLTSASSCRTLCTTGGKGIGEVLCLGTLNTLCLKRRSPVDRSNSCSLSFPSLFLSYSSFADPKVRVVLSIHVFYCPFIEGIGIKMCIYIGRNEEILKEPQEKKILSRHKTI